MKFFQIYIKIDGNIFAYFFLDEYSYEQTTKVTKVI